MSLASITSDQERQYRRVVEDAAEKGADLALEKVPLDKDGIQRVLESDKFGSDIIDAIIASTRALSAGTVVVGTAASVAAPANLAEMLDRQVARLLDVGAAAQAKVAKGRYRDQLMAAVTAFAWREDWAAIGLNRVAVVDFRLAGNFLAEAGGVIEYIAADGCTLYQGVTVPDGILVLQGQWGAKYCNKNPHWCRANFHALEQGLTVKERLTVHLYEGEALLRECYTDCPGSVSPFGRVPFLGLWIGRPRLVAGSVGGAAPGYGSGSRGK